MAVVGAGLVGSLWARMLGNRGHDVVVYERRPDPRKLKLSAGRSINLALSDRGWKALELAGLADAVREIALPITGRRMHGVDGTRTYQPYGMEGQCIYSVSRAGLNRILMECGSPPSPPYKTATIAAPPPSHSLVKHQPPSHPHPLTERLRTEHK